MALSDWLKKLRLGGVDSGVEGSSTSNFVSRAARVPRPRDPQVSFERLGQRFEIENISTTGVAFRNNSELQALGDGARFLGKFQLGETAFEVELRLVHRRELSVGCFYIDPPEEFVLALAERFEVEISALNVVYVNPKMLRQSQKGVAHWIQGNNNCGLYWISNQEQVVEFELTFLGHRWTGGLGQVSRFSQVLEDGGVWGTGALGDAEPSQLSTSSRDLAHKILNHMPCLEERWKKAIFDLIEKS